MVDYNAILYHTVKYFKFDPKQYCIILDETKLYTAYNTIL